MFGYSWITASELKFTFLSISERYKPYMDVLKVLLYRILWIKGVQDPKAIAYKRRKKSVYSEVFGIGAEAGIEGVFYGTEKGG